MAKKAPKTKAPAKKAKKPSKKKESSKAKKSSGVDAPAHENELTLEETKRMLPKMAKLAAMYEDCHTEASPMHERCAYLPLWAQAENLGIYFGEEGKPFSDGMGLHDELMAKHAIGGEWSKLEPSMEGYATLLGSKWEQFWARSHPENGASVTISHGDLRGDNLFLTDRPQRCTRPLVGAT